MKAKLGQQKELIDELNTQLNQVQRESQQAAASLNAQVSSKEEDLETMRTENKALKE